MFRYFGAAAFMTVSVSLLITAGCDSVAMPKTYPASGSAVFKGGQPIKGGVIQFTALQESPVAVSGAINDDGTFSLFSVLGNKKASGAPEGEYRVTVLPPPSGEAKGGVVGAHLAAGPIEVPGSCKVQATETNSFRFEVDAPVVRSEPPPWSRPTVQLHK